MAKSIKPIPSKNTSPGGDHWNRKIYDYLVSSLFTLFLFTIFSVYLYNRRGFYDLYIMNKIFAGIAAVHLGVLLLLGPLARLFNVFDHLLKYRKNLGIIAFFMAALHVISSLFFLGDHFPTGQYFTTGLIPFIFGLTAIMILTFIFLISNKKIIELLTFKKWWPLQNWGVRITFLAIALHVFVMKYPGWIDWYKKGGSSTLQHPEWPGLGLLVGWFILFVIILRLAEGLNPQIAKIVSYLFFPLLIFIYLFTFLWGAQFTP